MLVRRATGVLSTITALVAGYWGVRAMFTFVPAEAFFWLPAVTFAGPILLLVGGVFALSPKLNKNWLLGLVSIILATFWAIFLRESATPFWILAGITMFLTWAAVTWASRVRRPTIVALAASVSLLLIWLPAAVGLIRPTIGGASSLVNAVASNWSLIALWILIIATAMVAGSASFRSEGIDVRPER